MEVVGECADGFEAVKAVSERRPDLLLLDVQMPRLGGFEVLELVDPVERGGHLDRVLMRHGSRVVVVPVEPVDAEGYERLQRRF